jgi:hypothetical protein
MTQRAIQAVVLLMALTCAGSLRAQVGTISTGGLGGAGSFGARGFSAVTPSASPPALHGFGPCCGPGIAVTFGRNPRGFLIGRGFSRQRFFGHQLFAFPYGYGPYLDEYAPTVIVETPPQESGLPRQPVSHYEEHVPAAPLIIELDGDHWVRRRVVEAQDSRYGQHSLVHEGQPQRQLKDEAAQVRPEHKRASRH